MTEVSRPLHIAEQVVFVDGMSGTGKSMLSPILSSFARLEVQRIEHIYEFACALKYLGRIEEDAAVDLVRTYTDLACYNAMIGRESNFRWKDVSGVLSNPGGWRYLRRLWQSDGDAVMDRISRTRPIVHIHSHEILGIASTLFTALGDRLTLLEMVRHPLFLIQHWYSFIDRHANDSRIFTLLLNHNGARVPWFAYGWEDRYLESNRMDRVIYLIEWFTRLAEDTLDSLDEKTRSQVLVIPFERFVIDPQPFLDRIGEMLETTPSGSTRRAMRKQKIPRRLTTEGRDLPIYRRYSWQPPVKGSSEAEEFEKRWEFARKEASPEAIEVLERLHQNYRSRYLQEDQSVGVPV